MAMQTFVENVHGVNLLLSIEEALYPEAQVLLRGFSRLDPSQLRPGFKLEAGFCVYMLADSPEGLQLTAPDLAGNPFTDWVQDLTLAVWIQAEQADLLRLCSLDGESVRFDDQVAVARGALNTERLFLQRFPDLGGSGWCVSAIFEGDDGQLSTAAEGYDALYAYQLLSSRPALLRALALPRGFIAVFEGDTLAEVLDEKNESRLPE